MSSPNLIIEGQKHITAPKEISETMNRQYIQKIRKIISEIPPQSSNPLENYLKYLGPVQPTLSFTFKIISMSELRHTH